MEAGGESPPASRCRTSPSRAAGEAAPRGRGRGRRGGAGGGRGRGSRGGALSAEAADLAALAAASASAHASAAAAHAAASASPAAQAAAEETAAESAPGVLYVRLTRMKTPADAAAVKAGQAVQADVDCRVHLWKVVDAAQRLQGVPSVLSGASKVWVVAIPGACPAERSLEAWRNKVRQEVAIVDAQGMELLHHRDS